MGLVCGKNLRRKDIKLCHPTAQVTLTCIEYIQSDFDVSESKL